MGRCGCTGLTRRSSRGRADVDVDAAGVTDLGTEEVGDRRADGAPGQLVHQRADGQRVVAVRLARPPGRHRDRQPGGDGRVVEHLIDGQLRFHAHQAGLMGQRDADRHVFLAARGELGPVPGDRRVQAEHAALYQQRDADGRRAFGAREDALQVVGRHIAAAPQVSHLASRVVGAELPAGVVLGGQQPFEFRGTGSNPGAVVPCTVVALSWSVIGCSSSRDGD